MKSPNLFLFLALLSLACSRTGTEEFNSVKYEPNKPQLDKPAEQPDYTSKVPQFTFASTLEEQEEQLKTNPLMLRFKEDRKKWAADPHVPLYHFYSPDNRLNDPNGLSYWLGRWHLFFQAYPVEDSRQHWGHAVSEDLIHWRDLPFAIYPDPEYQCFSGAALVEDDRVIAMYHGTRLGNMVATSSDPLLLNWDKVTDGAPISMFPGDDGKPLPYRVFDPCIWKKDGMYYALSGGQLSRGPEGKFTRANWLFRSQDLANWEYLHPFIEDDQYSLVGDDGACPYFWPIGDKHIYMQYSHMSGGKYLIGDYKKDQDKFAVTGGGDFNFGPSGPAGVHAPSAAPEPAVHAGAPDGASGKGVIVIFNMNPGRKVENYYDGMLMTLPRRLTLLPEGSLDNLGQEPAGDYASLRYHPQKVGPMTLPANKEIVLDGVQGKAMEIIAEIDPKESSMIELDVFRSSDEAEVTRILFYKSNGYSNRSASRTSEDFGKYFSSISIESSKSSLLPDIRSRAPETAQVFIDEDETVKLHVFIDKSVVEVFVNGRQCVAQRVYPTLANSDGVSLRAQGTDAELVSLEAWQMKSIYEE
ncbi:MAG: glycoside hydrolase family 32 protein [Bacteroidetes bacterium]|nr:glycoside hydrolase family 32 protein [Bacteroidota bacterium]MDA1120405.1 glycoside hydrolase family 32 protein [Bacteroidota bacterium]